MSMISVNDEQSQFCLFLKREFANKLLGVRTACVYIHVCASACVHAEARG